MVYFAVQHFAEFTMFLETCLTESHGDQLLSFWVGTSARSWEVGLGVLLCTKVFAHLSCCISVKYVFNEMCKKLRELKSHVQRNMLISPTWNDFVILNLICLVSIVPSNFQRPSAKFILGSSQEISLQIHFQGRVRFEKIKIKTRFTIIFSCDW